MKKTVKRILIAAISLVCALILVFALKFIVSKTKKSDMTVYQVKVETYENVIEIAGTVSAANEQKLQAKNDGTVVGVYKKAGDLVKKGELILQEDDSEQVYNLEKLDYEIDQLKFNGAKRELQLKDYQRKSLIQKIDDKKIVATFDGIIADLDANVGDYLEAKDSIGTLVDKSYLKAKVEIAETDVSKLKIGQNVVFTFPAYPEKVNGYVHSFPAIGKTTSRGATVVVAEVRIDNVPEEILPNYSFSAKIEITAPERKIVVERNAIARENDKTYVEILDRNGNSRQVNVRVKPYGFDYVEVVSGLKGGEMVKQLTKNSVSGRLTRNGKRNSNTQQPRPNGNQGMRQGAPSFSGPPPF